MSHSRSAAQGEHEMAMQPALPLTTDTALLVRCRAALAKHRRRARADRQALDYDLDALVSLAAASPTCPYCGRLLHAGNVAFDHTIPTCRAADYRLGNV